MVILLEHSLTGNGIGPTALRNSAHFSQGKDNEQTLKACWVMNK